MIARSSSPFLNPDKNPLIHFLLKKTFYAQFCAGETTDEVEKTSERLKNMGYKGVILAYGKEIVLERGEKVESGEAENETHAADMDDIRTWKEGTLKTVEMTRPGDFIALKFTGAGRDALRQLAAGLSPSKAIEEATVEICERSRDRNVALLFDAEQDLVQRGIDAWTMQFQQRYNRDKAVVFGTYQAYLRATPDILAQHLATAHHEGFTLGVKLVRGAYMSSDPRELFWETKQDTDRAYDGITEALVTRSWNDVMKSPEAGQERPAINFVLATHNMDSVKKCMAIRQGQTDDQNIEMAYGQLMGMAEEVSCSLVMAGRQGPSLNADPKTAGPQAYQYCVWGSVGECLKFLVRRAEENRDAMGRALSTRKALGKELMRRISG